MKMVFNELLAAASNRAITDTAFRNMVLKALTKRRPTESVIAAFQRLQPEAVLESDQERAELRELLRQSGREVKQYERYD